MDLFRLQGPVLRREGEREGGERATLRPCWYTPAGFGPGRLEAGVSPDGERWGAGKVEPWSSGVREEKPRLTA